MNVQKGTRGRELGDGEFPVSAGVPIPLAAMHIKPEGEDTTFIQKWQEILSTFESSEQQTATALPVPPFEAEKTRSASNGNAAVAPQSTGQSDIRCTSLDGSNALEFEIPVFPRLSERITLKMASNLGSAACSNRCGDLRGAGGNSTKPSHPQSIEETKLSKPRHVGDADGIEPLVASNPIILPANPLTVAWQSDHPAVSTGTSERSLQHAPAHGSGTLSGPSSDSMAEDETLNRQVGVKGDTPALGIGDSSIGSSPKIVMHRAIQSTDAASFPIENELLPESHPEIRDEALRCGISISKSLAENPMDSLSSAHAEENTVSASIPRAQGLKASPPPQRASVAIRDEIPNPPIRDSFSIAAHSVNTSEMKPASLGRHEDSGAPAYACPDPTQTSLAWSRESVGHFEKANQTFIAIDERVPTSRWTLAGSHRAEAGFKDPSLGWVSVRAQAGSGGIHAVVVPASDTAAQVLDTHLAGLNAHMTSRYEHLSTVTLASPDVGLVDRYATGQSPHHDHRDSTQQEAQQGQEHSQSAQAVTPQRTSTSVARIGMEGVEIPASSFGHPSGEGHVSVIA